jgi:hypothetical protein
MGLITRSHVALAPLLVALAAPAALSQDSDLRMVIGANAICRAQPSQTAATTGQPFRLGDILTVTKKTEADGATWYSDDTQPGACWVSGPLTAEFSTSTPEEAFMAMFDHLEHQAGPVTFSQFVEVTNLLEDDFAGALANSGQLQYGELKLIGLGLSAPEARDQAIGRDPLKKSWILSHQNVLKFNSADDTWSIRPLVLWRIYDGSWRADWADDLAQTASLRQPYRENCSPECLLTAIWDGPLQYWSRLPNGAAIGEALQRATTIARRAVANACPGGSADPPVPAELVTQIRQSLATVSAPQKQDMLQALVDAERKCSGQAR